MKRLSPGKRAHLLRAVHGEPPPRPRFPREPRQHVRPTPIATAPPPPVRRPREIESALIHHSVPRDPDLLRALLAWKGR